MSIRFTRVLRGALLVATGTLVFAAGATAQTYPSRLIRIIVPWPAGGAIDIVARNIAQKMPDQLGQQVIVENRAGANGFIGTTAVARADPDGYTLLFADVGGLAISPAMRADTPYNPARDFAPITQAVSTPFVLMVHPAVPAKTLQELVAYARSRPGKLTYGSFGAGSIAHLAGAMLQSAIPGLDIVHVPYKGAPPAMTDLIGGQIDMLFLTVSSAAPHIQSGKLRGLAVTTTQRSALLPLPAIAEIYPGFEVTSWYGMLAPAGTPPEVVARLHKEIAAILATAEISQGLQARGFTTDGTTPEQFAAKIRQELAQWAKVVKAAGLVGAN
ncbi:MAG: tripartite tricarboxylate transporter substrate binding protein [Betaproteobacteria bacterium]|nr:tripartite tricarboxylate transporter substrate binding protein [Betaproteobacteria bacterium]